MNGFGLLPAIYFMKINHQLLTSITLPKFKNIFECLVVKELQGCG
jgi:hypothetical protein